MHCDLSACNSPPPPTPLQSLVIISHPPFRRQPSSSSSRTCPLAMATPTPSSPLAQTELAWDTAWQAHSLLLHGLSSGCTECSLYVHLPSASPLAWEPQERMAVSSHSSHLPMLASNVGTREMFCENLLNQYIMVVWNPAPCLSPQSLWCRNSLLNAQTPGRQRAVLHCKSLFPCLVRFPVWQVCRIKCGSVSPPTEISPKCEQLVPTDIVMQFALPF